MLVDRRLLPHLDLPLVAALLALTVIGCATIYSVTWNFQTQQPGSAFWAQVYALPVAFGAMVVCLMIDYRALAQRSLLFYGALLVALVAVLMFGVVRDGSRRWLSLGVANLQPSEFARLAVALALAMYFGDGRRSARTLTELAGGALIVLVPFVLIQRQPDLGTAVTLAAGVPGRGVCSQGCACGGWSRRPSSGALLSPRRLDLRAAGLSARARR